MPMITRRTALLASGGLLAAPPLLGQSLTRMRVGIIPIVDVAPLQAAIKEGYFAAEGIEVDTSPAPGGAAALPALVAGQFRVAFSNCVSILLGVREGLDFRFIADASRSGPTSPDINGVVVRKGGGIRSGKDLEGKRMASNTRNNIVWLRAMAWVQKAGGDWRKVNTVEVPFPQMADALVNGQVDAINLNEPFLSAALGSLGDKIEVIGWPQAETAPKSLVAEYVAMKEDLEKNGELFDRFTRALFKGVDWVNANADKPALFELMSGYTRLPVERLKNATNPVFPKTIEPDLLAEVIDTMGKFGLAGRYPAPADLLFRTAKG